MRAVRELTDALTTRARCLIAAGATALICGLAFGVYDIARAGVLALAVPIVSAIIVNRSRLTIASKRRVDPVRASGDARVTVELTISNRSMLPTGSLMLEDRLPPQLRGRARFVIDRLAGRESRTVAYNLPVLPRGHYLVGPLSMRLADPFGMVDLKRSFRATSEFLVHPIVEQLPEELMPQSWDIGANAGSHSVGSHGADDQSTREYRDGDDLRKIHWRSTARTGKLMVRHEERPWQTRSTLLLDTRADAHRSGDPADPAVDGDDRRSRDSLEWAVSAIASMGTHMMHNGRPTSLICDGPDSTRSSFLANSLFLDHLSALRASRSATLTPISDALRSALSESTVVAVLGRLDAASLNILTDARKRTAAPRAFALLLDTASWAAREPGAAETGADVLDAAAGLQVAGWRVVVVRRGDSLPIVWRRVLAAPAAHMTSVGAVQ